MRPLWQRRSGSADVTSRIPSKWRSSARHVIPEKFTKGLWASLGLELDFVRKLIRSKPEMMNAILVKLESGRARILQPSTTKFWVAEALGLLDSEREIYRSDEEYTLMLSTAEGVLLAV